MSAFGDVMGTLMAVRALVIGRIQADAPHGEALMAGVEELIARGERHAIQVDNYLAWAIRENHWPERATDEPIVEGLQERLGLHARDFVLFVRSLPTDALLAALKVAGDQSLE